MDKETKETLQALIDILLNSCTKIESDDDGNIHDHTLFDNVDRDSLVKLHNALNE